MCFVEKRLTSRQYIYNILRHAQRDGCADSASMPEGQRDDLSGTNNEKFLVLCNVDYNGNFAGSGTTDIGNEETNTVEDCINVCAGNSSCAGAGWGNFNGHDVCWLKGSLGKSQSADNWFFVIKQ